MSLLLPLRFFLLWLLPFLLLWQPLSPFRIHHRIHSFSHRFYQLKHLQQDGQFLCSGTNRSRHPQKILSIFFCR
ncbi:hypothetical protein F4703DRAFT_1856002 [Phycomyces blakesleeanus]